MVILSALGVKLLEDEREISTDNGDNYINYE